MNQNFLKRRTTHKKDKISFEISILAITILLFIYRTAIPNLKYPFLLLYLTYTVYFLYKYRRVCFFSFKSFLKNYYLIHILILLYCITLLLSNKVYLVIIKDLINVLIILSIFFYLGAIIKIRYNLRFFYSRIIFITIIIAIFITIAKLSGSITLLESYKKIDYNFSTLPIFYGFIGIVSLLIKRQKPITIILFNILLLLFLIAAITFTSRRAFILIIIIFSFLVFANIFGRINKISIVAMIGKRTRLFLVFTLSIGLLSYLLLFHTSYSFKNKFIDSLFFNEVSQSKRIFTQTFYRISNIFRKDISYSDYYEKLWPAQFDPNDPDSNWGKNRHKTIFPLEGDNVEIVPETAKGYLLDKTTNSDSWGGNVYSYTLIGNSKVTDSSFVKASVYCYVSNNFNGTWVKLSAKGKTFGINEDKYDLNRKGTWQKLEIYMRCKEGKIPVYLFFSKYNAVNFSSLEGFVTFAYPEYYVSKVFLDPKNPDSGWGIRRRKIIYPLYGNNVDIVPHGTKGYLMDSTCNASSWSGNAYSFTEIGNDSVTDKNIITASVFCYVSDDFNGNWVKINALGSTYGIKADMYNLKNKGTWQKLQIQVRCTKGRAPVYLYFSKYGVKDFSNLDGYVIFAYPQYKVTINDKFSSNLQEFSPIKKEVESVISNIYNKNSSALKKENKLNHIKVKHNTYQHVNMLPLSLVKAYINDYLIADSDPVRNMIKKMVSEDTTYYQYNANLRVDKKSKRNIASRLNRWDFAWQIFINEYNLREKLVGRGFDYLNWYGYYFYNDKTRSDWPHNPFLSVLLYSGIIGLIVYLIFIYKVFYYYWKYRKEYSLFGIFFLITFYFSFFSSNGPFTPPVMGFLCILPFFIHYIHTKDVMKEIEEHKNMREIVL